MTNRSLTATAMPPHADLLRRQDSSDGRNQLPFFGQLEYDAWAELLVKSSRNSFSRSDADPKFGPWARRPLPRYVGADELRRQRPPRREATVDAHPEKQKSRGQIIEAYRQEMMELVRNMPETEGQELAPYELSLRDIVESPASNKPDPDAATAAAAAKGSLDKKRKPTRASREEKSGKSGLFLIKAIMPTVHAVLGNRRKITGGTKGAAKGAKVSPKPRNVNSEGRSCSSGSSNSSNGSTTSNGKRGSCYLFLHRDRSGSMMI